MPRTSSPLRYPGGKTQLTKFVNHLVDINISNKPIYCEPFMGGAGVAIALLLENKIDSLILNDLDPAIYSIWKAILTESERLIEVIQDISLSIDEWRMQHNYYKLNKDISGYNFELGVSAFYLNRTNRSSIIMGGPIGGLKQESAYKLDCRFNKIDLINKIRKISAQKERIRLYNLDAIDLIMDVLMNENHNNLFTFFDPPYYKQGQALYRSFFNDVKHHKLAETIKKLENYKWIVTYDNDKEIKKIYDNIIMYTYNLKYSAQRVREEVEILFGSTCTKLESFDKVTLNLLI